MAKLLSGTRVYGNLTVDTFVTATGNVTGGQLVATNGLLYQSNQLQSNVTIDSADYHAISYGPYDIPDGLVLTVETNWRVI